MDNKSKEEGLMTIEFMKNYLYQGKKNKHLETFIAEVEEEVALILAENQFIRVGYDEYLAYIKIGNRSQSEKKYFQKRKQLVALGLYLQWQKDEKAMARFKSLIWDLCQDYSWALPAHLSIEKGVFINPLTTVDLFAAETAQMLAEFLLIYEDQFDLLLINEINKQVQQRVLKPFDENKWPWEKLENNWSAVCGSCVGITALILEKDPLKLGRILRRCNKALTYYFAGYGADGACVEGISYWVYGFSYYRYFADLYDWVAGVPLLEQEKVPAIIEFPGYVEWKPGHYVPFSDAAPNTQIPSGLLGNLGIGVESVTSFHFDHCYRWAHLSRILWWSTPDQKRLSINNGKYFEDAQWLVFRNEEIYFAAKGGHNNEPHNHNDVGHFVLSIQGELVLTDLGAGVYTADYFSEQRYLDPHTRSSWHSVPLINGKEQRSGFTGNAQVECASIQRNHCRFRLNIGKAYGLDTDVWREFVLDAHERKLVLIDEVDAKQYQMNFISYERPKLLKQQVCWEHLTLDFAAGFYEVWVEELEIKNHLLQEERVYRVCCLSKGQQEKHEFRLSWEGGS